MKSTASPVSPLSTRRAILALAAAALAASTLAASADDTPSATPPASPPTPVPVPAAPEQPDVDSLLFDARHFTHTDQTVTLTYDYSRTSLKPDQPFPSFSDQIELKLEPGDKEEDRNMAVTLFHGENHRAAGPFDGISFNPIIILMLEFNLTELAPYLHANPRYLKNAIRAAMRDKATIEKISLAYAGRTVDATKISVHPFIGDQQNRDRLGPFVNALYEFTISDAVPGSVYEIRISTPAPDVPGKAYLEEDLRYVAT